MPPNPSGGSWSEQLLTGVAQSHPGVPHTGLWGPYRCHSPCRWVQIACPRLSIDWGEAFSKPLLTPYEVSSPRWVSGGPLPALHVALSPLSPPHRQRWLLGTSSGNSRTPWTSMPVNPWGRGRPTTQRGPPRWALGGGGGPLCPLVLAAMWHKRHPVARSLESRAGADPVPSIGAHMAPSLLTPCLSLQEKPPATPSLKNGTEGSRSAHPPEDTATS